MTLRNRDGPRHLYIIGTTVFLQGLGPSREVVVKFHKLYNSTLAVRVVAATIGLGVAGGGEGGHRWPGFLKFFFTILLRLMFSCRVKTARRRRRSTTL